MNTIFYDIQNALASVRYDMWFVCVPILLLTVCILSRFLCVILSIVSPTKFGTEHRREMNKSSRVCYWLSVFAQALIWSFGTAQQVSLLGWVDLWAAGVLMLLAIAALLTAVLDMIFSRRGKRVFILKNMHHQAIRLLLMGTFLGIFGWVFMR